MIRVIGVHLAIAALFLFLLSALAQAEDNQAPTVDKQTIEQLKTALTTALGLTKAPEPQQPEWIPLDPKLQQWTDQVLAYWEKQSGRLKSLQCTFEQWDYEPQQVPKLVQKLQSAGQLEKLPFTNYTTGVIKYARPDKLVFRTSGLRQLIPPGDERDYRSLPKEHGPHWFMSPVK